MGLKERIKEVMGGMPPGEFAQACGVSPAAVTFWLSGNTQSLKADPVAQMELKFGYRASWVVAGKGPKKLGGETEASWRFSDEVQQAVLLLSDEDLQWAENLLRAHLKLPHQSVTEVANTSLPTSSMGEAPRYPQNTEEGAEHSDVGELPPQAPRRHARSTDRRPAREKGGRGA